MDVGIVIAPRNHRQRPRPLAELYREVIDEGVLAEELGFSHVWAAEHHFRIDAWNPSPLMLLTAVAARTKTIRLGTYIVLLSLQTNPLRFAEDLATLDIISNGRFDFGFAAANFQEELDQFGIPREEIYGRCFEALDVIEKAFTEEVFSHHGKYFHYDNVHNTTKPVQKPLPIYSAMRGPKNLARSAQRGYGTMAGLLGDVWERYSAAWVQAGRDLKDTRVIAHPIIVHIAPTRRQAWEEAGPALHEWIDTYPPGPMNANLPSIEEMVRKQEHIAYGNKAAIGTAEDVLAILSEHRGGRCDAFALTFHLTGMDASAVRRSMASFAQEVMPQIRTWPTGA